MRDELEVDPERKFKAHNGPVLVVLFTHDGGRLLTGSQDGRIGIWSVASGEVTQALAMLGTADLDANASAGAAISDRAIRHMLLNKDSTKVVVASDDGYVRVHIADLCIAPFLAWIFCCCNIVVAQVYDVQGTSKLVARCEGHEQAVNSVVCIPRFGTTLVRHVEAFWYLKALH
jgi:WD40 repeat protein